VVYVWGQSHGLVVVGSVCPAGGAAWAKSESSEVNRKRNSLSFWERLSGQGYSP